jgi:hypothetical protein
MKKVLLFLLPVTFCITGYSQLPVPKRIDSIVNSIESKKGLILKVVSDTFPVPNSKMVTIENVKFYSSNNKLLKVIFSAYYHLTDATKADVPADYDVYYFNKDVLIKVVTKDFDLSPPKDLQFYLNEKHQKKYLAKETQYADKYQGADYFVELGYNLLGEFKFLTK